MCGSGLVLSCRRFKNNTHGSFFPGKSLGCYCAHPLISHNCSLAKLIIIEADIQNNLRLHNPVNSHSGSGACKRKTVKIKTRTNKKRSNRLDFSLFSNCKNSIPLTIAPMSWSPRMGTTAAYQKYSRERMPKPLDNTGTS